MPAIGEPKRIAIFGGSFNPPHICHQIAILSALELHAIDKVWIVPVYQHAFNKTLAPYDMRTGWCRALIEPFGERADICDIEKDLGTESRTIDTMKELQKRHPDVEFTLLLGSDIRSERDQWKKFDELEKLFPILWLGRAGHGETTEDSIILPDISSSHIRELLKNNKAVDHLIPMRVMELINLSGFQW